ncbi:hypothetical protein B0H19DRAFT_1253000 [Mycena capillaripes]|nr:hypothetical protein B0H19DRAFT_1253000 [Mycena capillaripes]
MSSRTKSDSSRSFPLVTPPRHHGKPCFPTTSLPPARLPSAAKVVRWALPQCPMVALSTGFGQAPTLPASPAALPPKLTAPPAFIANAEEACIEEDEKQDDDWRARGEFFFLARLGIRQAWCTVRASSPPSPTPSPARSERTEGENIALYTVLVVICPPRANSFFLFGPTRPSVSLVHAYLPHCPAHPPPHVLSARRAGTLPSTSSS